MPTVGEIFRYIDGFAPVSGRLDCDNVGLLVGRSDAPVERVLVALDVLPETIDEAERFGAQLIVAHHPVIFRPASSVTDRDTTGLRVLMLAEKGVAAICMHTNLDVTLVNDALAEALGLRDVAVLPDSDGVCRYGSVQPCATGDFAALVRDRLHANGVQFADAGRTVERVAVGGGACGDYVASALAAGCDTLVVGEAKWHEFLDARMLGLNLVAAGHFPTEDVVCAKLCDRLAAGFPQLEVKKSETLRDFIEWR